MTRSMTLYALACRLNGKSPPRAALREILAGGRRDNLALFLLSGGGGIDPSQFNDRARYTPIILDEADKVQIFARPENGKAPLSEGGESVELDRATVYYYDMGNNVEEFWCWNGGEWDYSHNPWHFLDFETRFMSDASRIFARPVDGTAPFSQGGGYSVLSRGSVYRYYAGNGTEFWYWDYRGWSSVNVGSNTPQIGTIVLTRLKWEMKSASVLKIYSRPEEGKAVFKDSEAREIYEYNLYHYDAESGVEWWYKSGDEWLFSIDPGEIMPIIKWSPPRIYARPVDGAAPYEEGGEVKELCHVSIYQYHPDEGEKVEWWYWSGNEWAYCQGSAPPEPEADEPEAETEQKIILAPAM